MAEPSSTPSSPDTPGRKAKAASASPTPAGTNPSGAPASFRGRRMALLASTFDRLARTATDPEEQDSSLKAAKALEALAKNRPPPRE